MGNPTILLIGARDEKFGSGVHLYTSNLSGSSNQLDQLGGSEP
jgi:hypothetical protein